MMKYNEKVNKRWQEAIKKDPDLIELAKEEAEEIKKSTREDPLFKDRIVLKSEWSKVKKNQLKVAKEMEKKLLNSDEEKQLLAQSLPVFLQPYVDEIYYYELFDSTLITGITKEGENTRSLGRLKSWYISDRKKVDPYGREEKMKLIVSGYLQKNGDPKAAMKYIYDTMGMGFVEFLEEFYKFDKNDSRKYHVKGARNAIDNLEIDIEESGNIPFFRLEIYDGYLPDRYWLYKDWKKEI